MPTLAFVGLFFLIQLSGKQTCAVLQTCNRNTEQENHLLKVLVKHSESG